MRYTYLAPLGNYTHFTPHRDCRQHDEITIMFFFHLNKSLQINYQSVVSFTASTGHSCNKPRLRTTRCFQQGCDWWEFIWHSKFSFICFCYYRYLHFCNFGSWLNKHYKSQFKTIAGTTYRHYTFYKL